jgi:hypothetical protein
MSLEQILTDQEKGTTQERDPVWRDFDGDFGADLLAQHYQASH